MRAGHRCEGRGSDTVFISYFLVETTQQLFTFANKSETVRSYQPYPWLISTTYMALINHIHGSYQPHPWLLATTYMAHINHIHGSYQPHTWLISTTSMALSNHIHGSYQPHQWLLSTTYMAHINHIHGSYQPHPRRLHWSRQPSMLHKEQQEAQLVLG